MRILYLREVLDRTTLVYLSHNVEITFHDISLTVSFCGELHAKREDCREGEHREHDASSSRRGLVIPDGLGEGPIVVLQPVIAYGAVRLKTREADHITRHGHERRLSLELKHRNRTVKK